MIQADLPAGWQWQTIGEVCRVVPGFAFKSKDWTSEGIPVVKIKNIRSDCTVDVSEADCVPEAIVSEKLNKFRLGKGDILIAMTGATAGKVGWLSADGDFLLNQRVAKLEPVRINKLFFWGVVSGRRYQELFFHLADGAAQPNMSGKQIEGVPIPVPPVALQETIAGMVATYDDLIETNTRRIAILEEMARRLYEEWFVHFRFPGHEAVEFERGLPRSWSFGHLSDIAQQVGRSMNPGNEPDQTFAHFSFPAFDTSAAPEVVRGDAIMSNKLQFTGPVVLLAKLNPRIERVWPVLKDHEAPMVTSTEFIPLAPRKGSSVAMIEAVVRSRAFRDYLLGLAGGTSTSHQRVKPKEALGGPIPLAPPELRERATVVLDPWLRQRDILRRKNANLRAQRDLLLPKLVSGEIDVSGAEAALEAAE